LPSSHDGLPPATPLCETHVKPGQHADTSSAVHTPHAVTFFPWPTKSTQWPLVSVPGVQSHESESALLMHVRPEMQIAVPQQSASVVHGPQSPSALHLPSQLPSPLEPLLEPLAPPDEFCVPVHAPPGTHRVFELAQGSPWQQKSGGHDTHEPPPPVAFRHTPQPTPAGVPRQSRNRNCASGQSSTLAPSAQHGSPSGLQERPQWCWPAGQSLLPAVPSVPQQNSAAPCAPLDVWQARSFFSHDEPMQ
jgi:hypothetical protein